MDRSSNNITHFPLPCLMAGRYQFAVENHMFSGANHRSFHKATFVRIGTGAQNSYQRYQESTDESELEGSPVCSPSVDWKQTLCVSM